MGVRTNADTPEDAKVARSFGAEGIGLFRTEHMFYGKGSDEPLFILRKMIMVLGKKPKPAKTKEARRGRPSRRSWTSARRWSTSCSPSSSESIKATLEAMDGPAGDDPPVGPAVARVRAAGQGRPGRIGQGAEHQAGRHPEARRGAARDQPHDGPSRHPPGHHLSRSDRDAGPGHLRGGRRADQGRQGRQARDHGPRHLRRQRDRRHQGHRRPRARRSEGSRRAST